MRLKTRKHKFNAEALVVDGVRLDSKAEAARYYELVLMQKAGLIRELRPHPQFFLHTVRLKGDKIEVVPLKGVNGRDLCYEADFSYKSMTLSTSADGLVVEDVK